MLLGCNNPGGSTSTTQSSSSSGNIAGTAQGVSPSGTSYLFGFDQSSLAQVNPGAGGAGGASASNSGGEQEPASPSIRCGDAVVGADEECDAGDEGNDACTAACQTRDQLAVPAPAAAPQRGASRVQGQGRHPLAGGDSGFISVYVEPDGDEPLIGTTVYDELGQPILRGTASSGSVVVTDANPVAAALPQGEYALAWNDFGGDGSDMGIALRKVSNSGQLSLLRAANQGVDSSQANPDLLWTGEQLVAAWVDYADATRGPDIRYRLFDADLNPLSEDLPLATTEVWEADVALTRFGGGWAAAYREGMSDGHENIVVKSGDKTWRVGPLLGGVEGDKPALVELDSTHLLVAYTEGTDPTATGVANTPRVRYAVVDTTVDTAPVKRCLGGTDSTSSAQLLEPQTSPALERGQDGVFLAWRTEARPGDAAGDQAWLKSLGWSTRGPAHALQLEEHDTELLLPRLCESSTGDQRQPALARTSLYPNGALAVSWDDYSHSLDANQNEPDVVVHYAPNHVSRQRANAPELVTESWTGDNLAPWPARWKLEYDPAKTKPYLSANSGYFHSLTGAATSIAALDEPLALNADITVTFRFTGHSQALGMIVRRAPEDPTSYLLAKLSSLQSDSWRIQAVNAGVATDIVTAPQPPNFYDNLGYHSSWMMRFRAATNADGSVFVGMKGWPVGLQEPAGWMLSGTIPGGSPLTAQLGSRPGRIALLQQQAVAGPDLDLDDFRALYFTGAGDLDVPRDTALLPLKRDAAKYRRCTPDTPCTAAAVACCTSDSECTEGLACLATQAEFRGVGSHARVCAAKHCGDLAKTANTDETFADAGGNDCAPRDCVPTAQPGGDTYCSQSCPCGVGEGDCIIDSHCLPGLSCGLQRQEQYFGTVNKDACVPLHCLNRVLDADKGESLPDCGGPCGDNCACSPVNDGHWHCRVYCPCSTGNGSCLQDDECAPGLVCGLNQGAKYGFAANRGICVPPVCVNGKKDTAAGETSIDFGGPCVTPTGITLAEAMADFPSLQYRKVSYGLETADYMVIPSTTPLTGSVTSPVFKRANRFLFNVPVATDNVPLTFNVGSLAGLSNPAMDIKLYNSTGTLVKSATVPQNASTSVVLGRLGGNYEMDVLPHDNALTYSITRGTSIVPNMAVKDGVDLTGPATPLYFYVPAEVDVAFLLGNFDSSTAVQFFDASNSAVTPRTITPNKLYAIDTRGKPGVWHTSFTTTSLRAHLVNLPDVFSFSPYSVFGNRIIRTALKFGPAPASSYTMQYLRNYNRFLMHSETAFTPAFTIVFEDGNTSNATEVRVMKPDGTHVQGSPLSLPLGSNDLSTLGQLPAGDYELEIPTPTPTVRYKITVPAGVHFVSINGFNTGNVWFASYRDYIYVPTGTSKITFASSNTGSIFKVYNPSGTLVTGQPVSLGNGVFEVQGVTPGTWSLNIQSSTNLRLLNLAQAVGFEPGMQVVPALSPPFVCAGNADCPAGQVCGIDNGARFERPASDDICWDPSCASTPPAGSCGSALHVCGLCP